MKPILFTTFALVAFAFNSILCRLALLGDEADAVAFTEVRLISAAATLILLSALAGKSKQVQKGLNWFSAFFLFAYAICFSFAYLGLSAGTGALVLFGSVQMTMIAASILRGEWPTALEWIGLCISLIGLVYLVFPALESPPIFSSFLMVVAGISWGLYSLRGKGSKEPLAETTSNFILALLPLLPVLYLFEGQYHITPRGFVLAIISGAVTSGVGYAYWYAALKYHSSTRAAVLQLVVPVIAAVIAIVWLGESMTVTLVVASAMILGGIGLTIVGKKEQARTESSE